MKATAVVSQVFVPSDCDCRLDHYFSCAFDNVKVRVSYEVFSSYPILIQWMNLNIPDEWLLRRRILGCDITKTPKHTLKTTSVSF